MTADNFKPIKYRGKPISNLKQSKDDASRFLADFRVQGKRYRQTFQVLLEDSNANMIRKAMIKLDELIQLKDTEIDSQVSKMTLDQYFDRHIQSKSKSNKWSNKYFEDTKRAYNLYVKDKIGMKKITAIKSSHITDVMHGVSHLSLRSQKLVLEVLKPLFNKAVLDDGILMKSPIMVSHNVKRNAKQEKKIILDAVNKYKLVHETIHSLFANDPRNRAILLFGFYGRRKTETLKIKWEDINLDTARYIIRGENSKAKVAMTFSLPQDLVETLRELSLHYNMSGYVFESFIKPSTAQIKVDTPVLQLRQATGIDELTFHWLRNLAVSALSAKGVAPIHLSALLGHTDINTINKYLSLQREESTSITNTISNTILLEDTKQKVLKLSNDEPT